MEEELDTLPSLVCTPACKKAFLTLKACLNSSHNWAPPDYFTARPERLIDRSFTVLLTNSFVYLVASTNLEKKGNERFSKRHDIHWPYGADKLQP